MPGRGTRLIFKKIPIHIFENFHNLFSGSTKNTFNICRECGGACEHKKVGTLLPGEKEYMAGKMGISVSEFEARFLDILEMDDGIQIHVLKLGELCPFLNTETDRCECTEFKPILCKIYPLVFTIKDKKVKFVVDDWCELSKNKECKSYFENAVPLFSTLLVPAEWFIYAACYDNLCFDYD